MWHTPVVDNRIPSSWDQRINLPRKLYDTTIEYVNPNRVEKSASLLVKSQGQKSNSGRNVSNPITYQKHVGNRVSRAAPPSIASKFTYNTPGRLTSEVSIIPCPAIPSNKDDSYGIFGVSNVPVKSESYAPNSSSSSLIGPYSHISNGVLNLSTSTVRPQNHSLHNVSLGSTRTFGSRDRSSQNEFKFENPARMLNRVSTSIVPVVKSEGYGSNRQNHSSNVTPHFSSYSLERRINASSDKHNLPNLAAGSRGYMPNGTGDFSISISESQDNFSNNAVNCSPLGFRSKLTGQNSHTLTPAFESRKYTSNDLSHNSNPVTVSKHRTPNNASYISNQIIGSQGHASNSVLNLSIPPFESRGHISNDSSNFQSPEYTTERGGTKTVLQWRLKTENVDNDIYDSENATEDTCYMEDDDNMSIVDRKPIEIQYDNIDIDELSPFSSEDYSSQFLEGNEGEEEEEEEMEYQSRNSCNVVENEPNQFVQENAAGEMRYQSQISGRTGVNKRKQVLEANKTGNIEYESRISGHIGADKSNQFVEENEARDLDSQPRIPDHIGAESHFLEGNDGDDSEYQSRITGHTEPDKESDKTGTPNGTLPRKRITKLPLKDKPYICRVCNIGYVYKSKFQEHIKKHTGKNLDCHLCNITFLTTIDLRSHLKAHYEEFQFKCKKCNVSFSTKLALTGHKRMHASDKCFRCNVCERWFTTRGGLRDHIATHSEQKYFQCPKCNKQYATRAGLKYHAKTHDIIKPFACPECHRRFTSKTSHSQHVMGHYKKKYFRCDDCEKRFLTKSQLRRHEKIHATDRSFHCTKCDKGFTTKQGLAYHMRTHIWERSFVCIVCDKKVRESNMYQCNLLSQNQNESFNCTLCKDCFKSNMSVEEESKELSD